MDQNQLCKYFFQMEMNLNQLCKRFFQKEFYLHMYKYTVFSNVCDPFLILLAQHVIIIFRLYFSQKKVPGRKRF